MQHRRAFLTALAAGSLVDAAAAVGVAMAKNGKYVYVKSDDQDEDRFRKFICMQLDVLQMKQLIDDLQKRGLNARRETVLTRFYAKSDDMLAYAMSAFPKALTGNRAHDEALHKRVHDLFELKCTIDTLCERDLRATEDALIVISLAKNMVSKYRMPWRPVCMPHINAFAVKYRNLIFGNY